MYKSKILLSSIAALAILNVQSLAESETLGSVDVWETEVISSSVNLGQSSIETKQADHLSDLLRDIPGIDVGGSHSMNNKIIIRGVKDEDINITIDGAKMPNVDMFHHQGTLKINPDILKKVNIEVGANSIVHGELGGSIEFETKDGKDFLEKDQEVGGIISANYNSNKSIGGSLSVFGKITENTDFFAYYSYVDNGNWNTGDGTEETGRDGEIDNILLKYAVDIDESQRVSFSYDKMTDEGDYLARPNFSTSFNNGLVHPTEYVRDTYTIKHEIDKGENLLVNTTLYMNDMDLVRYEDNSNSRGDKLEALVRNKGLNTKAQSNIDSGEVLNTLTYGATYDIQTSEVDTDGSNYGEDEEARTLALFIEDAIDFGNGFILTPGIRFNHYKLDGVAVNTTDKKLTYSVAGEYSVNDNLTLLASHTTLFKGVPMQEVFAGYRGVVQSADVESETGHNNEIGFSYIQDNTLGANQIGFSAKYFRTVIDNYIDYAGTWPTNYYPVNTGETITKGVEASFAYNLDSLSAYLSYSHADTYSKETGGPLDIETGDIFALNLTHQTTPEIQVSWKSIVVLDESDISNSGIDKKEGYNVHDIALKYTPKSIKGLKVIAGIDNIFDKHYASHSSYYGDARGTPATDYEPGRNFKVTLSYKF